MKINPAIHTPPLDRKRDQDKDLAKTGTSSSAAGAGSAKPPSQARGAAEQVHTQLDPGKLQSFIDELKGMDPSDVHRVEELQQQIADGSYRADADDLVDNLLAFVDDRRAEF